MFDFQHIDDLKSFDPQALLPKNPNDTEEKEVCEFFLVLTLIFNDFQDISWMWRYLNGNPPAVIENPTHPYSGRYSGMRLYCRRRVASLLCELLKFIKTHKKVLECKLFKEVLNPIPEDKKLYWKNITSLALCDKKDPVNKEYSEFMTVLAQIRNNGVFHYDQIEDIGNAYKAFFNKYRQGVRAFVSLSSTYAGVRFYFADAAMQALEMEIVGRVFRQGTFQEKWKRYESNFEKMIAGSMGIAVICFNFLKDRTPLKDEKFNSLSLTS